MVERTCPGCMSSGEMVADPVPPVTTRPCAQVAQVERQHSAGVDEGLDPRRRRGEGVRDAAAGILPVRPFEHAIFRREGLP